MWHFGTLGLSSAWCFFSSSSSVLAWDGYLGIYIFSQISHIFLSFFLFPALQIWWSVFMRPETTGAGRAKGMEDANVMFLSAQKAWTPWNCLFLQSVVGQYNACLLVAYSLYAYGVDHLHVSTFLCRILVHIASWLLCCDLGLYKSWGLSYTNRICMYKSNSKCVYIIPL